jgi:type I restriction enzyme S subunit
MLKGYKEYREINTQWLPSIPKNWTSLKIGELFDQRRVIVSDKKYAPLTVGKMGVVPQLSTVAKSNDSDNRKLVKSGDYVINSRSDRKGSSGLSSYDGSVSLINIVLTPRAGDGRYYHYLLRSHYWVEEFYRNGRGIVADLWTTRFSEMKSIVLPIPSRPEQDQIGRYLDWKVSMINKYINAKKKQIELLKEQKQAIINQAVTKGLDPKVPMKDSGIEWLGKIPAHWEVVSLRRVAQSVKTGGTPNGASEESFSEDGADWYTPGDFTDDIFLKKSIRKLSKLGEKEVKFFPPNAIFIIGIGGTLGKVAVSKQVASCNQQINVIICKTFYNELFLAYYLKLVKSHIFNTAKYTTLPILNQEETKNIPVLLVGFIEQKNIIDYLITIENSLDIFISSLENQITFIQEYRTRLISDVVTGKVNVQNVRVPEFEMKNEAINKGEEDENNELEN